MATTRKKTTKKTTTKKTAAKKTAAKRTTYVKLETPKKIKNSRGKITTITHVTTQKITGSNEKIDKKLTALPPGKRISSTGKVYYERRQNRTDVSRRKRI